MISRIFFMTLFCLSVLSSSLLDAQKIGGPCEGCEAIHEYGDRALMNTFTLPGYDSLSPKLKITGTVYEQDGKTPAPDVIIYIYHTDRNGIYEPGENPKGWERRHGQYRGWIKTGKDGKYTFHTFRPASYPDRREPEHIHFTVKEPDIIEYYIDDIVFRDDPLLTDRILKNRRNRAGSGVSIPQKENDIWVINRDIILGKNIPHYGKR